MKTNIYNINRASLIWIIFILIILIMFVYTSVLIVTKYIDTKDDVQDIAYSDFITLVNNGLVERITFSNNSTLLGVYKKTEDNFSQPKESKETSSTSSVKNVEHTQRFHFKTLIPNDPQLVTKLLEKQVKIAVQPTKNNNDLLLLIFIVFESICLVFIGLFLSIDLFSGWRSTTRSS